MVITFPQMGNITLAAKAFFEEINIPCVVPQNNKRALQTGTLLSPDEMCLPFKLMMGNYVSAISRGADTILITGSCGPCRFGEYCELQMKILNRQGLRAELIVADSPREIGVSVLFKRLGRIGKASAYPAPLTLFALRHALRILKLADEIDARAHWLAGFEAERGVCRQLLAQCRREALACRGIPETMKALQKYRAALRRLPIVPEKKPLRVALVGEIYSMIEPFSNMDIEDKLMDYGVSSSRLITPSWWLKDLALKPLKLNSRGLHSAAKPYLPFCVGGHAVETLAHAELCARRGFDGAVQIFPVGCMPEIVAAAVLPEISAKRGFPVLKLVMDEITGETGYLTRIEAFLDMLEAARRKGESDEKALLSGY